MSQAEREAFVRFPDQVDFFDRIRIKALDYDTALSPEGFSLQGMLTEFGGDTQINELLNSWNASEVDPANRDPTQALVFPRTWDDFIKSMRFRVFGAAASTDLRSGPAYEAFLAEFVAILKTSLGVQGDLELLDGHLIEQNFINTFNEFLKEYRYDVLVGTKRYTPDEWEEFLKTAEGQRVQREEIHLCVAGPIERFIDKWRQYLSIAATSLDDTASGVRANAARFEQIFAAFFPNADESEYKEVLNKFVDKIQERDGFFNPSHHLADWFEEIKSKYLTAVLGADSVKGTGASKLEIIFRLFRLVVDMIETIQNATAAMAERLSFFTKLQKAYTDLIGNIPKYTKDDIAIGVNNDNRDSINDTMGQATETMRSFRSLVTDDSKQLQSTVNQLNEGVNQQANLATAILQQMSGILQSIFR